MTHASSGFHTWNYPHLPGWLVNPAQQKWYHRSQSSQPTMGAVLMLPHSLHSQCWINFVAAKKMTGIVICRWKHIKSLYIDWAWTVPGWSNPVALQEHHSSKIGLQSQNTCDPTHQMSSILHVTSDTIEWNKLQCRIVSRKVWGFGRNFVGFRFALLSLYTYKILQLAPVHLIQSIELSVAGVPDIRRLIKNGLQIITACQVPSHFGAMTCSDRR